MMAIEFPEELEILLKVNINGSATKYNIYGSAITDYAQQAEIILNDNKTVFFPNYTDHGPDHVNSVLKSMVELVPSEVWDEDVITAADAVVVIGSAILHDIAMHLSVKGFLELVKEDTRFKPLPWFYSDHQGYSADCRWPDLWDDYQREARKFNDQSLGKIIGEKEAQNWKFDGLSDNPGSWGANDYLVIGEFIRRHHARLAHEIAIYGFPGLDEGLEEYQFPGEKSFGKLKGIPNLIGLTARSHGMGLRVCQRYLDSEYPRQSRSRIDDCAIFYPMALLRVADYLQIDKHRAPAVLLQLKNPESPISQDEWEKHQVVIDLQSANDRYGIYVKIDESIKLKYYLQVRDLLNGLQSEMDHSTAVLDEIYGLNDKQNLSCLSLSKRRVHSGLDDPAFLKKLPFVPERTGFSADPNILTLLVEPLYGQEPSVGVRELIQNAVDAVLEREAWEKKHGKVKGLPELDEGADVLIDFVEKEGGKWILRVQDRGIGMTADTIQNYFLRAGASFRNSPQWTKEFTDDDGNPEVVRSGRFGVGAFAIFLLGASFKLWTRHVGAEKNEGYFIETLQDSSRVEVHFREDLDFGTIIEIPLHKFVYKKLCGWRTSYLSSQIDWYFWEFPKVIKRHISFFTCTVLKQSCTVPNKNSLEVPEWSEIKPNGIDSIMWSFEEPLKFICNGIKVFNFYRSQWCGYGDSKIWPYSKSVLVPGLSIIDKEGILPLTVKRDMTLHGDIPFSEAIIEDVYLSIIAHALLCGPCSQEEIFNCQCYHPLINIQGNVMCSDLSWWCTPDYFVPFDLWTLKLLASSRHIMFCLLAKESSDEILTLLKSNDTDTGFGLKKLDDFRLQEVKKYIYSCWNELDWSDQVIMKIASTNPLRKDWGKDTVCEVVPKFNGFTCYEIKQNKTHFTFDSDLLLQKATNEFSAHDSPCIIIIMEFGRINFDEEPKSVIAKIWNKCLGPNPIPFDPIERAALIEKGKQHPDLRRHIEKWERMKDEGSKWVTGGK